MKKQLLLTFLLVLACITGNLFAQVNLTSINTPYPQDFNTLLSTGTSNDIGTLPSGWTFLETGTNANTTYAASTGSANAGNTYSLGLDVDRALGGLRSGTLIPLFGASFINNTGATITELQISYTGEQWRLGATSRASGDRLDFQFSLNASSLSTGTWTDENALDFSAPIIAGTVGLLNGNAAANRVVSNFTISGLSIPAGASFWIRWTDLDIAGADDALGIDDFSITPKGTPPDEPTITFTPSSLNFGEINTGTSRILSYLAKGENLSDSLTTIIVPSSVFSLSLDQINYNDTLTVTDSARVYVKFSPAVNGAAAVNINHTNGTFSKALAITGSGYDPLSNIISIATARSRTTGSKVTVAGRVTVADQQGSPSFVQDATGGIPVFDFTLSNNVEIGDSIIVTGPISLFNDQKQISGSGISFIKPDSSKRILAPKPILVSQLAANEGLLVTVQQVSLVNKSFVFYPQSTERITDGTTQADLRIDGDTNIPGLAKPQTTVDITGVVGRFRANAQLLPRFREDVPGATEPQTASDSIPKTNTFDLLTWNLEFFGAEREDYPTESEFGPADEPLQLRNAQRVISSINADIIAVQEVSSDSLFNELVAQLPGYEGVCSNRFSRSFEGPSTTFPPQKVCFIYDTATVQVESFRAMFESLYDSARNIDPTLLPGYPTGDASSFWSSGRLPFMLTANVTVSGVTEKIRFINLHAKSGSTASDYNRRLYDGQVLKDTIDAQYPNDHVVILGDLNDDLDQSIVSGRPTSYLPIVSDTASYLPVTRALSLAGAKSTISFNDMIDHQIITNELEEEYLVGSERVITPFGLIPSYGVTTSDHLPVLVRYAFIAPSASITTASATVTEGADSVLLQISLSRPVAADKVLTLSIQNGAGANYSDDYVTSPSAANDLIQVTVPAGSSTASVLVNTIDDAADELAETVTLQLLPTPGVIVSDSSIFTLTILDNDLATIEFAEAEASREEGSGAYAVKLKLGSAPVTAQTIAIRAVNGQGVFYGNRWDYTTSPAINQGRIALSIPAGVSEISFEVTPNRDLMPERRPEAIYFSIVSISEGLSLGTQATSKFNIIDVRPCLPVFVVFPNPTFGAVNIFTLPANQDSMVEGTLFDPNGQLIASGNGTVAQLSEQFSNTLQGRRRGFYVLRLAQCDEVITIRIFKL
jgi:hypothetical protein